MTIFDEFTFSAPVSSGDPVASAKSTLIKNLEAQLEAATSMVEGKPSKLSERSKWFNRHSPDAIQIRGNGTMAPSPREFYSLCSHPMT